MAVDTAGKWLSSSLFSYKGRGEIRVDNIFIIVESVDSISRDGPDTP